MRLAGGEGEVRVRRVRRRRLRRVMGEKGCMIGVGDGVDERGVDG